MCIDEIVVRIKDRKYLIDAFHINPIFLQHEFQNIAPDFRVTSEQLESFPKTTALTTHL